MSVEVTSTPKTILLKGDYHGREAAAVAAITPGMLVERATGADAGKVKKHATADGVSTRSFALENEIIGKGIDDDYAAGDRVLYGDFDPGSYVYALVGSGEDVEDGEYLASAGDGTLKVVSPGAGTLDGALVAQAVEDKDNSAGPGTARLRVKVL